jgi:hypothetical protein
MEQGATDILVDTANLAWLDETLHPFGAVLVGGGLPEGYVKVEGHYVMRVFGDPAFVERVCRGQGYATVVRRLDELV